MKVRITSKGVSKSQFGIQVGPGSGFNKWLNKPLGTGDLVASLADPTGVANWPFVNQSVKNMMTKPSWSNAADLGWNILGSIPFVGGAARTAKAVQATNKASKLEKAGRAVGKYAIKPITKVIEAPATVVNKAWQKAGVVTPSMLNPINTFNRGLRGWEAGFEGAVSGLDALYPGTPVQKAMGGQSNNMKIIITGKGLAKAQYENSQVGAPTFPTFKQSIAQTRPGSCPDGEEKNPFTGKCEPKPNFGASDSPQIQSNLGEGFIKNPITGTYGMPAQPQYPGNIYQGTPSESNSKDKFRNTMFDINRGIQMGFDIGEIGSNIYSNYLQGQKKQINRKQHLEGLPDWQTPSEMYRGMWTTNQGRQSPIDQYTPNLGQTTGTFYPQMNYAKDGLEVPRHVDDVFVEAPYPMMPSQIRMATPDISAITGSPETTTPMSIDIPATTSSKSTFNKSFSNVSVKGTDVATRNNNPGNMLYHPWMKQFGAMPSANKAVDSGKQFAKFPDLASGMEAYKMQLFGDVDGLFKSRYYKANTPVDKALKVWSGNGYGEEIYPEIAGKTLGQLTQREREELIKRQIRSESGSMYKQLSQAGIFQMGGESINDDITNTNSMKIRIIGTPTTSMAYGGQLGYGFDLGQRNTYSKMSQNSYEKTSNTLQPVPRSQANIEAEKGETAYGDIDGDGQKEHMKIGGERHSNGGTPLNVSPGSFIFSDTAKMKIKDPEVLKFFGLTYKKGGYTPAEIAKRYDINKYKGILQDPYADNLNKKTAKRMIDSYEQKLGYLALIQESMKGFPQGIPEVAENIMGGKMPEQPVEQTTETSETLEEPEMQFGGGLHKYQTDGQVRERKFKIGDRDVNATYIDPNAQIPEGYNPVTGVQDLWQKPGTPGTSGTVSLEEAKGGKRGSEDKYWRTYLIPNLQEGVTPEELVDKGYMDRANLEKARRYYKPIPGQEAIDDSYLYTERPENVTVASSETPKEEQKTTSAPAGKVPDVPYVIPPSRKQPLRWDVRDEMAMLNALGNLSSVRKDLFDYSKINPVVPRTAMEDWLSKAQQRQQTYKTAAETLAQSSDPQGLTSNLSFMAGKTGEGTSQDITGVNQANIAAFIGNEREKANILNNAFVYNAGVTDKNRELRFNVNRQYDTDKRLARNAALQAWMQGRTNAVNLFNLNQTESPYYTYNPRTGLMEFNPIGGKAAFEQMKRRGYTGTTDYAAAAAKQAVEIYNQVYNNTPGEPAEKAKAAQAAMSAIMGDRTPGLPGSNIDALPLPSGGLRRQAYGGQQAAYGYTYNNPFLM